MSPREIRTYVSEMPMFYWSWDAIGRGYRFGGVSQSRLGASIMANIAKAYIRLQSRHRNES